VKRLWPVFRSALFSVDPEAAHDRVLGFLEGLSHSSGGRQLLQLLSAQAKLPSSASKRLWGLDFRTPVGLAAGFDKNGRLLRALPHLGFGFAEIGSVTPKAQLGNPRPRMSRDPSRQALWNAMGFNNEGAEAVARRLAHAREAGWIPSDFPVGVNLGKNKDTPNEQARLDYFEGARLFLGLADYLVINLSSPNTPGLRALQEPRAIRGILDPILELREARSLNTPILLKLAPEIEGEGLGELLSGLEDRVEGWVLTNTLQSLSGDRAGGLSGGPLRDISRLRLKEALSWTSKPVISCGGILDVEEARSRRDLGATLIQVYTGYIYGGPSYPVELSQAWDKTL